ncbi:hypothetical protein [Streptomyces sp. URMC 129]|uniref:hypothetical protein n=1 Tax=Streptomyces sp. URMC 129 TaxID=3423407 RepID=UPI003F19FD26
MIIREFSYITPDAFGGRKRYRQACRAAGLDPVPGGYGLLHTEDDDGGHFSLVTTDVTYVQMLVATPPQMRAELVIPPEKFAVREGWPDEWRRRGSA